jgi:Spy/CpxP family protein refolding chaperone
LRHARPAIVLALFASATLPQPVNAQGAPQHHQPYAGLQDRPVKAFSDQQIADLRAGRGMSLALAAELNGYPGPLHVLEHADALGLSAAQRQKTKAFFEAMRAEAVSLGERLVDQEAELDRLFATKTIQRTSLDSTTAAIAATQGALRAGHLRHHLAMIDLLTPEQVRRYAELRGYAGGHGAGGQGHGAHSR